MTDNTHERFIGHWELEPGTCDYKQGDPPRVGSYIIYEEGGELVFDMAWTDLAGATHEASFRGTPDGEARPFKGGDLVDSLKITAENRSELNSSAAMKGETLMRASRTLIDDDTMRIVQTVYLPDGTAPTNKSVYRRRKPN
ncbi:MAG: hypothetical protein WA989_00990 [Henriciella sp.]|uniref:hypothetical protein n=1 Tax=Henriciella sp. TaxID=1968823 RepID=UPI003C7487BC